MRIKFEREKRKEIERGRDWINSRERDIIEPSRFFFQKRVLLWLPFMTFSPIFFKDLKNSRTNWEQLSLDFREKVRTSQRHLKKKRLLKKKNKK